MACVIYYQLEEDLEERVIKFDATLNENVTFDSDVTDKSVEGAEGINDHVRPQPELLSVSVIVSDDPVVIPTDNVGGQTGLNANLEIDVQQPPKVTRALSIRGGKVENGEVSNAGQSTVLMAGVQWTGRFFRVQSVIELLNTLRKRAQLLRVTTRLREYDSMILKSIEVPLDAATSSAPHIGLTFKKMRIVSTQTVDAHPRPRPSRPRGEKQDNSTAQATKTPNAAESSAAADLVLPSRS